MDYTPRQIMHMVQQGMKDAVLSSRAIWLCATCFTCTVRCPRSISVADVLAQLRGMALAQGYAETRGMTFNKSFLTIVRRYGRMFEPELLIRYHLRQQLPRLLGMAPLGWTLFRKGKVGLLPDRLKPARGGADVQRIFQRVAQRRQEQAAAAKAKPAHSAHEEA
jgi:heterodisulfide reductase subunit C